MAKLHGKDGVVKVGANVVAHTTRWTLNPEIALGEASEQGQDWEDHLKGQKRWSGAIDAWFDPGDTNGQGALELGDEVELELYPSGSGSGAVFYSGTATVESTPIESSRDNTVSISFNFRGKGELTRETVAP